MELKADLEIVLQDPIDKLARFELIEHRGEQNRKAIGEVIFLDSFFRPEIILASPDDELDFVMRLKFVQIAIEIVPAFAAAGAFQVDDLDDLWVYPPMSRLPPVSSRTVRPDSIRRSIRGKTSFCNSGSPPVTSTNGQS